MMKLLKEHQTYWEQFKEWSEHNQDKIACMGACSVGGLLAIDWLFHLEYLIR